MTESSSEGTQASTATGSTTKKTRRSRTKRTAAARKKSRPAVSAPKGSGRRKGSRKKATSLESFLKDLSRTAAQAGQRVSDLSGEGKVVARRAVGKVTASSKKTIARVKKEWSGLNTPTKVKYVAALLGALAAASGTLVASRKKR